MKTGEVVIVGGGMAGCLAAYYLGAAGVRAVLIERSDIGSQSSGNSAGGLNPLHGPAIPGALEALAFGREGFVADSGHVVESRRA